MNRRVCVAISLSVGVVLILLLTGTVSAQTPTPDEVNEVARELYCPLCSGLRVDVCYLPVCYDMREIIAEKLAAGESKEEIKQYFYELYGPKVLGAPERRGWKWLTWILPGSLALLALAGGAWWLRYHAPRAEEEEVPSPDIPAEYQARLERELQRFESEV